MRRQNPFSLKPASRPLGRKDHGLPQVFDLKSALLDLSGGVMSASAVAAGRARHCRLDRISPKKKTAAERLSPRGGGAEVKRTRSRGAGPGVVDPIRYRTSTAWAWISALVAAPVIAMANRFARSVEQANPDHWYHD